MSNDNHDPKNGQFTSSGAGAAVGDHQRSQSKPQGPGRQPVLSAKAETIAKFKRVDETHYPSRSVAERAAITDQGKTSLSPERTKPYEPPGTSKLNPSNNDHINQVLRGNSSATPRVQPTAGQMIGAGIIKGN